MPETKPENRIRQFRVLARISQEIVSVGLGISQAQLSRFERGTASPSEEQRARLADVLGVAQEFLFPTDEDMEP